MATSLCGRRLFETGSSGSSFANRTCTWYFEFEFTISRDAYGDIDFDRAMAKSACMHHVSRLKPKVSYPMRRPR